MKSILISLAACCLLCGPTAAQNLIPNPGFETFSSCPTGSCEWFLASNWNSVNNFPGCNSGNSGSPDYFHTCGASFFNFPLTLNASLNPLAGNAVMGLSTWLSFRANFREYLSVPLTSPLVTGMAYTLRFFYTNGQPDPSVSYGGQGTQLAAHFSVGALSQTNANPILLTPTYESVGTLFSQSWQEVTFTFTATANFTHLTFGNFRNDASTTVQQFATPSTAGFTYAYYYFDEISVEQEAVLEAPELELTAQKTPKGIVLRGSSAGSVSRVRVERSSDGSSFGPMDLVEAKAGTFSFLDAFPLAGTNLYRVRYLTAEGLEGVSEVVEASWEEKISWTIGPVPVSGKKDLVIRHNDPEIRTADLRLMDIQGRVVQSWQLQVEREATLDLAAVSAGIYFLEWQDPTGRNIQQVTVTE